MWKYLRTTDPTHFYNYNDFHEKFTGIRGTEDFKKINQN